ncbi:hypothetical protein PENTCL1PPCAC_13431 [Pristionchus entomophagus]|uniref:Hedgehog protein Hint domain-containing protein n=1 Tax=Pristionchus entomophagus TaxID=358040 RepID=A0AAV5T833_9BILA|nr:hypothetical protein PENTCL1PPCAC_13431 [Pristionchus entomophagus]
MSKLKTGDEVLSLEGSTITFSPVIMFLHRDSDKMAQFIVITTESGASVKLTNEHLIYVSDCVPKSPLRISAKDVTIELCLIIRSPALTLAIDRIMNINKTLERGIYSPLTATSDIIVNHVISSCHSNLAVRTLQQSFFSVHRSIHRFFSFIISDEGAIPFGVSYIASVIDLFIPAKPVIV